MKSQVSVISDRIQVSSGLAGRVEDQHPMWPEGKGGSLGWAAAVESAQRARGQHQGAAREGRTCKARLCSDSFFLRVVHFPEKIRPSSI